MKDIGYLKILKLPIRLLSKNCTGYSDLKNGSQDIPLQHCAILQNQPITSTLATIGVTELADS
jgi:hypothetical protein